MRKGRAKGFKQKEKARLLGPGFNSYLKMG
jgi:hypothetical protein